MTYKLILGDRTYSSWSLRGWLLIKKFGLSADIEMVRFSTQDVGRQMAAYAPARTVPTLVCPDGAVVWDSLAIAEELASRQPEAGLWPKEALARAMARNLAAEMHSGFTALRSECPMNLRTAYKDAALSDAVATDLRRLEVIWDHAWTTCQPNGPWLCGEYSAVDAFFAPVAARIAGYGLEVSASAQAYVAAHLADPDFRDWRAQGLEDDPEHEWYRKDFPQVEWPLP